MNDNKSFPYVKGINAKQNASSSEITGLTPPSTATSESSIANNFSERMDALMLLREGYLASLRVSLDNGWELPTSVGCGPKQSDWLAQFDPVTRFLKTRQLSLLLSEDQPSTESVQQWPRSGMIVCGMLFQPQPLAPDIGESVSVSFLPTPWASANESRQTKLTPSQQAGTHGQSLQATVISEFFLPTPTAHPDKRSQEAIEAYEAKGKQASSTTIRAVREHFLPTPTSRDYKDTPGMAKEATTGRLRDDQLPRRIYQTFADESPAQAGGTKLSEEFLSSLNKSRLSPEFQSWLQGFPENWLKPLRSALETASALKRSSQSPKPSPKRSKPVKPIDPLRPF